MTSQSSTGCSHFAIKGPAITVGNLATSICFKRKCKKCLVLVFFIIFNLFGLFKIPSNAEISLSLAIGFVHLSCGVNQVEKTCLLVWREVTSSD